MNQMNVAANLLARELMRVNDSISLEKIPQHLLENKEVVVALLGAGFTDIDCLPKSMWDVEEVVKLIVKVDGCLLKQVHAKFHDNYGVAVIAVGDNSKAIKYLSKRLRGMRSIVTLAIENNHRGYRVTKYLPNKFLKDRALMLKAVTIYPGCVWYLENDALEDRDMAVAYATKSERSLKNLPIKYHNDKELMIMAMRNNGLSIKNITSDLKLDDDVIIAAIKNCGGALEHLPDEYRNNRQLTKIAIESFGRNIQYASEDLRRDPELVRMAVEADPNNIQFIKDERLLDDKELALIVAKGGGDCLKYMSQKLMCDFDVLFVALSVDLGMLRYVDEGEPENRILFVKAIHEAHRRGKSWSSSAYIRGELRNDRFIYDKNKIIKHLDKLVSKLSYMSTGPLAHEDSPFYNLSLIWGGIYGHSMFDLLVKSTPGLCAKWLLD